MNKKINLLIKHPLFAGSMIMITGSTGINAVNYLYHLLMGRLLGPAQYGALVSVFSLLYMISIVPISTSFAIVRFIGSAKNKKDRNTFYSTIKRSIFRMSIVLSLLMIFASPFIAEFLHLTNILSILMVSPILFFMLITLVNQSTSQGVLKFWGVVGPNFVSSVGKLMFGVFLVYFGFSIDGAILGVLLAVILAFLLSRNIVMGVVRETKIDNKLLKPFLIYALPVLVQALAFTSLFTADVILVKHFFSEHDAGLYAAISMLGKIVFFAAAPITHVMFPLVSRKSSVGEDYKHTFFLTFAITSMGVFSVVGFYYLFPEFTIQLLYGSEYLEAQIYLVWMGLFIAIYTINNFLVNFVLSLGKTRITILPLIAAIAQITLIYTYHDQLLQVLMSSLIIMTILFIVLLVYLSYFYFKKYVKRNK